MAKRRLEKNGLNAISKPKSNMPRKVSPSFCREGTGLTGGGTDLLLHLWRLWQSAVRGLDHLLHRLATSRRSRSPGVEPRSRRHPPPRHRSAGQYTRGYYWIATDECVQAGFNAWQDYSTGRVMASISGMLPSAVLVIRDGNTFELASLNLSHRPN
jgi:hypothetical protein